MNTKKAITITAIAIALTGLITGAIFLAKKTGIKPKLQTIETKAEYYFSNYQNNNIPKFKINGTVNEIKNGVAQEYQEYTRNRPLGTYQIERQQNTSLIAYINVNKLVSEEWSSTDYSINVNLTFFNIFLIESKNIDTITITSTCEYQRDDGTNQYWDYFFKLTIKYVDNTTQTLNTQTRTYSFDSTLYYFEDYTNVPFDTIDVKNNIATLKTSYETGYTVAGDVASPVDIRGLMLNILTMPFTFISQAFNVTMWEGTQYQINIGNFIKSLIAIATILFIIKMFTSGFAVIGNYTSSRSSTKLDRQQKKASIEKTKAETRRTNNLADKGK